jgi:precorrin-6A/cobalt-precorrin-6A reductase
MTRILLLGGTTEASLLARAVADAGLDAVFSYAGRTADPVGQPLPQRIGGFGGVEGLRTYLVQERISHVVDATHPFAAQMSRNAVEAADACGIPLIALQRMPWQATAQDHWTMVADMEAAVDALPPAATRVFLAIGRQHIDAFARVPQHHYLLRLVDQPSAPLPLPNAEIVISRGPFRVEDDLDLLRQHRVQVVVAKNSGGVGARAKIDAARVLGLPVVMIGRPALPTRAIRKTVPEVMAWLGHSTLLGV